MGNYRRDEHQQRPKAQGDNFDLALKNLRKRVETLEANAGKDELNGKIADITLLDGSKLQNAKIKKTTKYNVWIDFSESVTIIPKHAILKLEKVK